MYNLNTDMYVTDLDALGTFALPSKMVAAYKGVTVCTDKCMYHICGNFRQEKIFVHFYICFYHANFLSCVKEYIEYMATFTALAKIYSSKYFCSTKVTGLGQIFVK